MGTYDFEEELSDNDGDDFLEDDIRSLSRACMPPSNAMEFSDEDDGDNDDDLELVRSIKEQYGIGIGSDISRPLSLKPLISLPPISDDDDDDDFETLRAIQNRFSQYAVEAESKNGNEGVKEPLKNVSLTSESLDVGGDDVGKDMCNGAENMQISTYTSSFPMGAHTFVEAIKRNRACQKFLRAKMLHVEARMEEIKEIQKRVKTLRDFQVHCKRKIGRALSQKQDARVQLISVQKQRVNAKACEKNVSALGPLDNSHVVVYKSALKAFPLSFHREKWSKAESQLLQKEIVKQFQERLFQKSVDVLSALEEPGGVNGVDNMISSITNIEITPDIIQDFSEKVDWNQLASRLQRRTGPECEARWLNHENSLINQKEWTTDEDKHLLLLIQKIGLHSWIQIAEKLGTNRTPFQCLARYQRSLNASILKRDWTEDEDAQLRSAVEAFGSSNWQAVASVIEGRTGTQCSQRWNKTLLPARERVGKWSDDEDKRLRVASTLFGYKSWNRIANFVPGRTQAQCRERWKNVLDPSLNLGQWSEEEDMKLEAAIAEHGYCWSKVALCLSSRTDNQCRRRWKRLFPNEVQLLEAARRTQKVALISNFVDRESERPALGVNDFVPLRITDSTDVLGNEIISQPQTKSRKRRRANPSKEIVSSCDQEGAGSRKRKRKDISTVGNSNHDEALNDNGCDTFENKKRSSKSGFKRKKASGNLNISTEPKKSRNKMIKSRSRTQGADVIDVPLISNHCLSQSNSIHDTVVHSLNQNGHPEVLQGQLTSWSNLGIYEEDMEETTHIVPKARKKKRCRKSSLAENTNVDQAGTTKRKKKRKSESDDSLEWQDLPLSTLFNKAVTRIKERKSIVRPPIRFTYVRRNKKATLESLT